MSGSRRLSLRARMLVLLIGVTTIFLLTMGTVSTVILAGNVTTRFKTDLIAESDYTPGDIAAHPNGYAAVLVTRGSAGQGAQVGALTHSATTTALAAAVTALIQDGRLRGAGGLRSYLRATTFTLRPPGGGPAAGQGPDRPPPRAGRPRRSSSWPSPPVTPPRSCAGSSSPS